MSNANSKLIATFTDEANGIEATVVETFRGFGVAIRDLDSGEYVDSIRFYKTEAQAIAKAKEVNALYV